MRRKPIKIKYRHKPVILRSKFKQGRPLEIGKIIKFLFIAGVLAGVSFWGYMAADNFIFKSDIFTINRIDIYGLENITKSEIMALVPFRPGDNMFNIWLSTVEKSLEKNRPELKNVSISRRWKAIRISLKNANLWLFWWSTIRRWAWTMIINPLLCAGIGRTNLKPSSRLSLLMILPQGKGSSSLSRICAWRMKTCTKSLSFLNVESLDSIVLKLRNGTKSYGGLLKKIC